ncbi:CxxxxCH/CxxCH domain c-type cytochrome [Anaeromyxobacter diazotrophicus]|uniref:Outer membrane cytochrome MtrC/MtrF-like domain-containing protein n=1 Tax=Anaeromyxobacter diazotrophicus TaxID=2590199 RepID=A0A7I9VKY5_9BACT|nr:CxxxxCH/CxxCH domain-containing protein [Anaeromyxobacter diazotrophicus]GEJ57086.1 hypothetical protein AMYX_18270 [Anaeromyxobacter diazotrophicus]
MAPGARALNAPTAAASHQEFKAAGYTCADCHPCGGITTGHGATWMDPASPAFHALAANRKLSDCQTCHGANLDGVGGQTTVGCQSCHGPTWRTSCTMCHGGTDGTTGAPPKATYGNSGDAVRVGAHTAHVAGSATAQALACDVCHVVPTDALDPGHVDGPNATVTFGGLAVQGGATPAAWDRAAPTCSGTYCHGNFKNGNAQNAPDWTQVGKEQAKCGTCHALPPGGTHPSVPGDLTGCATCHPASVDAAGKVLPGPGGKHLDGAVDVTAGHSTTWMAPVSPDFHATSANRGLGACQSCHGQDLAGGFTGVSCAQCHGAAWATTCTMCHGGSHEPSGAPPKATWGHAADLVRVGAHTAHVKASASAPGYDCALCHVKPADAFAPGHIDGATAAVQLGGLALAGGAAPPPWNRAAPTCASTYCHGAFPNGNAQNLPDWTKIGQGQASCGTCHGLPPGGAHPAVAAELTGCAVCHPDSVDASGAVKPTSAGGKHLDGAVDVKASHDPSWVDPASASFHALSANRGLAACQTCHGQDLGGGFAGVSCAQCHGAAWKTTCTMCHGGTDNATGAPPKATWGQSGDAVRTGAHGAHVGGSARAQAYDCVVCHVTPADALSAGHVDGPLATVTFGGVATTGSLVPTWDRSSATCASTYCHGATLQGGTNTKPTWTTLDGTQAKCGTCHGAPPPAPHPAVSGGLGSCAMCHQGSVDATGAVKPYPAGQHLDGTVQNNAYHPASWGDQASPGFHAFTANQGLATCQSCHGAALDGGSAGVACAQCHGAGWASRCTTCHGGTDNATGAPPRTTWGQAADLVRVGAHSSHVGAKLSSPIDCGACHVKPADAFAAGHLGAGSAEVSASLGWDRASATCATASCHGTALSGGTLTKPVWTKVDGTQDACGTCHGLPPTSGHVARTDCGTCHAGYTATTVNAAAHVNGKVDVVPMTCSLCHGDGTRAGISGADANVQAAPPVDSHGSAAVTARGVGAHLGHVNQANFRAAPIGCAECHFNAVPAAGDTSHANGAVAFAFGPLAKNASWGGVTPNPTWNGTSCASTYCHGAFKNGANATIAWAQDVTLSCTSCHGAPPGGGHPQNTACGNCHTGYTATSVNKATHANGALDVVAMTCTSCHGKAGQTATAAAPLNAAPPVDTLGASTGLRVGAHQAHVAGKTYTSGIACQDCHPSVGTYTSTHANGVTNVAFTNGTSASFNVGTYTARSGTTAASCASTWCHAVKDVSGSSSGGTLQTPAWSGSITSCTACHGTPPSTGRHSSESAHRVSCSYCHGGTYTSTTVDKTRHVNGVIEVNGSRIRSWNASTRTCSPTCHGSETWDSGSGGSGGWGH